MKHIFTILVLLLPWYLWGQIKELNFKASVDFLKLPDGFYLQEVAGVAVNSKDHVFVFHRGKHPLLEFDSQGNFLRSIADDMFITPHSVKIDRYDNIWTVDMGAHVILKFSSNLKLQMVLGRWNRPGIESRMFGAFAHQFNMPTDIAFDSKDNFYISDGYGNSRVMKFDQDGTFIKTWGVKGDSIGQFDLPHTIVIDSNDQLYVGDRQNQRIQVFNSEGDFVKAWALPGHPWGLAMYADKLYVSVGTQGRIIEVSKEGKVTGTFGSQGKKTGQLEWPHLMAVDSKGNLLVAEIQNWRIQRLTR